ncbi:MAG: hypothetical protein VX028_02985 [Nanoarchaeota archaeon]|nr:hypothetical protein [Nanoarchaeota archaeon]
MLKRSLLSKLTVKLEKLFQNQDDIACLHHITIQDEFTQLIQAQRKLIKEHENWVDNKNKRLHTHYPIEKTEIYKKRIEKLYRLSQMKSAYYEAYTYNRPYSYLEQNE